MRREVGGLGRVLWVLAVWLGAASLGEAAPPVAEVLQGYLAERRGDPEGALGAFREALAADPDSATLRVETARLLAGRKRFGEALGLVEEGLARGRETGQLRLLETRLLEAVGRRAEAAKAAYRAAELGAGEEAHVLAVRFLVELDRYDEALGAVGRWAEAHPASAEPHLTRGRLLEARGDRAGARQAVVRALDLDPNHRLGLRALAGFEDEAGNLATAEALYRRVIDANPHDVDARFRLGQVLLRQGRDEEALGALAEAERWGAGDPSVRFRLGMLLLQADRPEDAEAVFRAAFEAHQGDPRARYLLGVSQLAQEKHEEALATLGAIPAGAPEYTDALVRRAIALTGLGRKAEARALLEDRIRGYPDDEEVLLALAGLLEDAGDYRAAVDLLEEYVARRPTDQARMYFTLGVLHDKLKDWARSAEYMKQSLERDPDDPHALNYLGYTYAEQGIQLEEAERLILRALELKPGDGFITDSLGWVYFKQGRFAEAVATLEKALVAAPNDPVIWEHLGDARSRAGDREGARAAYERTLELAPDGEAARRKLEGLR